MEKVYYYHRYVCLKDYKQLRFTIAGRYNENYTELELNIAICSIKDQFNKRIGRTLTELRLEANSDKNPNLIIPITLDIIWYNCSLYKPFAKYILTNAETYQGLIFNEVVKGLLVDADTKAKLHKLFNIK
jgi:hypothetical protein